MTLMQAIKRTNKFMAMQYRDQPELKKKNFIWKIKRWFRMFEIVNMFGGATYFEGR